LFGRKVEAGALASWLIVAMSAPFVLLAGKYSWLGLALAWVVTGLLCRLITGLPTQQLCRSRAYCILQFLFLSVVLAFFANWSEDAWPTGRDFPVVPLTLLALAVLSAYQGAVRASRVGAVLFWLIAALYGALLTFGSRNVQFDFLQPQYDAPGAQALLVLLLPALIQFIPREIKPVLHWTVFLVGGLFVALSLWTIGGLSFQVSQTALWPFYEAGKSVSVLGIAERLEAFISVAATVGCFGLFSMFISAMAHLAENIRPGWGKYGAVTAGSLAAGLLLFAPEIPVIWLLFGALTLWCLFPFVGVCIFCEKNKKK
jgi:hypothetical protein